MADRIKKEEIADKTTWTKYAVRVFVSTGKQSNHSILVIVINSCYEMSFLHLTFMRLISSAEIETLHAAVVDSMKYHGKAVSAQNSFAHCSFIIILKVNNTQNTFPR